VLLLLPPLLLAVRRRGRQEIRRDRHGCSRRGCGRRRRHRTSPDSVAAVPENVGLALDVVVVVELLPPPPSF
jgi:hypothetical protein